MPFFMNMKRGNQTILKIAHLEKNTKQEPGEKVTGGTINSVNGKKKTKKNMSVPVQPDSIRVSK